MLFNYIQKAPEIDSDDIRFKWEQMYIKKEKLLRVIRISSKLIKMYMKKKL